LQSDFVDLGRVACDANAPGKTRRREDAKDRQPASEPGREVEEERELPAHAAGVAKQSRARCASLEEDSGSPCPRFSS